MNSRDGSAKQKAEQSVKNVNYAKWARTPTQSSASTKKALPTQLTATSTLVDSTSGASPTYNVRFPPVTAQKAANSNEEEQESSRSSPERIPLIDRGTFILLPPSLGGLVQYYSFLLLQLQSCLFTKTHLFW